MEHQFQIRPEDVAAYIVFQFKGLERTLAGYKYDEIAQAVGILKSVFIQEATERAQKLHSPK